MLNSNMGKILPQCNIKVSIVKLVRSIFEMYILVELLSNQVYISFILVKTSQKFEEVPITTTNVLKEGRI